MKVTIHTKIINSISFPFEIYHDNDNPSSKSYGRTKFTGDFKYFSQRKYDQALYFLFRDYFTFLESDTYLRMQSIFINEMGPTRHGFILIMYIFRYLLGEMEKLIKIINDPAFNGDIPRLTKRLNRKGYILKAFFDQIKKYSYCGYGVQFSTLEHINCIINRFISIEQGEPIGDPLASMLDDIHFIHSNCEYVFKILMSELSEL